MVSLAAQKLLSLLGLIWGFYCFSLFFAFILFSLGDRFKKKKLLQFTLKSSMPMLSSGRFMISDLILRSFIFFLY